MTKEAVIADQDATQAYVEGFLPEDEPILAARGRAEEVGAAVPIGPAGGAALRFIATVLGARTVVEIGTGVGVSGIHLLRGMRPDGILTSVDVEPEHQRLARLAYTEAGFAHTRARLITGRALEVLSRLTDAAYDLVFCDASKQEYVDYLGEAMRLLRTGGVVAFDNALWEGKVADSTQRDPNTAALREVGKMVRDDERLQPALLPVGDGLLVAVKI